MRSLLLRSLDIYLLKAQYRYGIALFLVGGFVTAALLVAQAAYPLQLAWGLVPGAPMGLQPGSVQFLALLLLAILGLGILGMALGALLLCLLLALFTPLTFKASLRAVFLSYYPQEWFAG